MNAANVTRDFFLFFAFPRQTEKNIPERIRTSNLRLRRPTLYPIELRGLWGQIIIHSLAFEHPASAQKPQRARSVARSIPLNQMPSPNSSSSGRPSSSVNRLRGISARSTRLPRGTGILARPVKKTCFRTFSSPGVDVCGTLGQLGCCMHRSDTSGVQIRGVDPECRSRWLTGPESAGRIERRVAVFAKSLR